MQKAKIQSWCEGIIEAGWIAALIVAPLFFNVYSSRVFEPDKISLIRSIALIMLMAYLIRLVDGGRLWLPRSGQEEEDEGSTFEIQATGFGRLIRIPLLPPLLLLIAAYVISTILSVAPYVSWWGSYQRLQGTYTFLSYVIIAVLTAAHLRTPDQLRRLQHALILTSLPISIYGIIQHYAIDPLPWGGDVVTRVSANAGNPIFLSAHLIMAFFLTLERVYSSFAYLLTVEENGPAEENRSTDMASAIAGGCYLFVAIVQLLAILWTQSRGPWLGLAAGLYLFVLLLLTGLRPQGYRRWTAVWVGLGSASVVLLLLLNTTGLGAPIRDIPYVGRLTTMLESDSGTGKVRTLIWEGVSQMVAPHEPLTFPDGEEDFYNPIRPLVGYGPEAMWVAYNSFYPPELAQIEARNASPDRAHNETWDSLAITGALGFIAYVLLFFALFYWALRWLGLITSRRDLYLFAGFWLGSGILLSLIFYLYDQSWRFFGVALPTGFIAGLVLYITVAVYLHPEAQIAPETRPRQLLLISILAAIVAHYVEIHFGIAIAATRTYFWIYSALLLVLGIGWLRPAPFANPDMATPQVRRAGRSSRRSSRRGGRREEHDSSSALPPTLLSDLLVMLSLAYLYTTNFQGRDTLFGILNSSLLFRMDGDSPVRSPGILFLVLFTWLIATLIGLSVAALNRDEPADQSWWVRQGLGYGGILIGGWLVYALIQAARLVPGAAGNELTEQLGHIAGHFTLYTWVVVVWMIGSGLYIAWSAIRSRAPVVSRALISSVGVVGLSLLMLSIVSQVNVALVKADVFYKQGQQFDNSGDYIGSVELYRRALEVRPTEDHYMLFLGRSLLEQAKKSPLDGVAPLPAEMNVDTVLRLQAQDVANAGRADLLRAAEAILLHAQRVNPLNTDHTANLARLHRSWADLESDPDLRQQSLERSLSYYEKAVTLSPNAAHLWNEMGATLTLLGREDEALDVYLHSLKLDEKFENTYLLLAELYERQGDTQNLMEILEAGLTQRPNNVQMRSYLGVAQARSGQMEAAVDTNLAIVETNPNDLNASRNLAILYRDLTRPEEAVIWGERATSIAESQNMDAGTLLPIYRLLIELYSQLGRDDKVLEQYERMHTTSPADVAILRDLTTLYVQGGRLGQAAGTLEQLIELEPEGVRNRIDLARIQAQIGNNEEAQRVAEAALPLASDQEAEEIRQFLDSLP